MVVVEIEGHEDSLDPVLTKYMKSRGYEKTSGFADFAFEKGRRRAFYVPEDFKDKFFKVSFIILCIFYIFEGTKDVLDIRILILMIIISPIIAGIIAFIIKWKFASESKWLVERICDLLMGSDERIYARISSFKNTRIELIIHTEKKLLERDVEALVTYLKTVKLPDKA